jgi:beta-glucosidase
VGDGGTSRGINANNTEIDWHGLLRIHMPGYYQAVAKGVGTIMVSYSSWNGKKMHANRNLVTNFLKKTLRFRVRQYFLQLLVNFLIIYMHMQ